ncbi:MAG: hypothetical protein ACI379_15125, partial [Nocardioides sp.]|uniref:hypothetical protein n=1 Tax=Nocardioides sp. TaxID=35761 RepID=UPI003F0D0CD3
ASVVAGARVLAAADDSVQVWAVARDLWAGEQVTPDDLVATAVRFSGDEQGRYLLVAEPLPDELHLTRAVGSGELVPREAFGAAAVEGRLQVSLAVASDQVPTDVVRGSLVDVWVVGGSGTRRDRAEEVLSDVAVLDLPSPRETFGSVTGRRQVVVGVTEADADALEVLLAASGGDAVRLVAQG